MFRLTYAMELLMEHAWLYQVLSDRDWSGRHRIQTSESVNSICLLKSALDIAFNDEGKQILPVPARISGQVEALNELLKSCGWIALPEGDACPTSLRLWPDRDKEFLKDCPHCRFFESSNFAARAGDNEIDVAFVHDGIPAQPSFQTVTVARCSATSRPV
jgi:hypothetical protein